MATTLLDADNFSKALALAIGRAVLDAIAASLVELPEDDETIGQPST